MYLHCQCVIGCISADSIGTAIRDYNYEYNHGDHWQSPTYRTSLIHPSNNISLTLTGIAIGTNNIQICTILNCLVT